MMLGRKEEADIGLVRTGPLSGSMACVDLIMNVDIGNGMVSYSVEPNLGNQAARRRAPEAAATAITIKSILTTVRVVRDKCEDFKPEPVIASILFLAVY